MPNNPALAVDVVAPKGQAVAGEWTPLTFSVQRPEISEGAVKLVNVDCRDRNVYLDAELFQRDLEVRSGETYRVTLFVRVAAPGTVDLSAFYIEYVEPDGQRELFFLPSRPLVFLPP